MIVIILQAALVALALVFSFYLIGRARRERAVPTLETTALGAVTNFFDALGIGSFAPTTAYLKFRRAIPDSFVPPTLNVGHALPTVAQALIFISLIEVDPVLLLACIVAAVAGALVGAPIVVRLPIRAIQAGMGVALLIAALLFAATNLGAFPAGGEAISLTGTLFPVAVAAHFVLGALMTLGIGLYAPSLILLSLMGLNPKAAFPIMMGACAFLMPTGGLRFLRSDRLGMRVALGLALGGIPGVLAAAYIVKSLDVEVLRWGVVVVVLYAGFVMLRAALTRSPAEARADTHGQPSALPAEPVAPSPER